MKYVSIDIETTGLDPDKNQILEIAAVCDDLNGVTSDDHFHCFVQHQYLHWSSQAQVMHRGLMLEMDTWAPSTGILFAYPHEVDMLFWQWLERVGNKEGPENPIVFAGKNFSGFDKQFLQKLPAWHIHTHHRSIDPGPFFLRSDDTEVPSLSQCLERSSIPRDAHRAHRALDDAMSVVRLIRHHYFDRDHYFFAGR